MAPAGTPPSAFRHVTHLPIAAVLSEEFFHRLEWALNTFFEQEIGGDRRREWGIAQSVVTPLLPSHEKLKVGHQLGIPQLH